MAQFLKDIWTNIADNDGAITALCAILTVLGTFLGWWFGLFGNQKIKGRIETSNTAHLTLSLDDYEKRIATKLAEKETQLTTTHEAEKATLLQQIEELHRRAADPQKALSEANETIIKLEEALSQESDQISSDKVIEASKALESGNFTLADQMFEDIENSTELDIQSFANIAFARGQIAEQDVRWADALRYYEKATILNPTLENLKKADEFAWRTGKFELATELASRRIELSKLEFGLDSPELITSLNDQAVYLGSLKRYEDAESLFKEIIEIDRNTIGETHPEHAKSLNNLANLYRKMELYSEAELLFKKALEIGQATIGEMHPNYATRLNNLASLYIDISRLDEAEILLKKVLEIDKNTIGTSHPEHAFSLNNLAMLYRNMGRYMESKMLYQQAIEIADTQLGSEHPHTKAFVANYEYLKTML